MRALPFLVWLSACGAGEANTSNDAADADTDTDTDTDADTDTDTDVPTLPSEVAVSDLSWRLHELTGSLVHVSWTQSGAATVHVEVSFDAGIWESTPSVAYEAGTHERLVVGIPYAMDAEWRVVVEGGGATVDGDAITTAPVPSGLPRANVTVSDPARWLPEGKYLLTSMNEDDGGWTGGTYWTYIVDRQARPVWARRTPNSAWTLFAQVSVTGDYFLWDEQTYWSDFGEGEASKVHRQWLDEEIEVIATPGLHHAFVQLPDETIVYGSQAHGGDEALVEKAPGQADETIIWTCADEWPNSGRPDFYQNCESNGIFYVEATDSFLYSFYTNNSLVEVDHQTGASLWWAGEVEGGYEFDPRNSQFSWQHGVSYTDAGTLLLSSEWDGGDGGDDETWLMEYEVDQTAGTLTLVWSNNSDTYASTNGQAWRLDNGNSLHLLGAAAEIREVEPGGEDVWRIDFGGSKLIGQGDFIEDLYTLVKPTP